MKQFVLEGDVLLYAFNASRIKSVTSQSQDDILRLLDHCVAFNLSFFRCRILGQERRFAGPGCVCSLISQFSHRHHAGGQQHAEGGISSVFSR